MEFMEIANNANKPTGGLETIEFQMSVFDSIPYKAQADMLVDAIKQQDTGSDEFEKTVQLYLNQDIDGMINMMSEEGQDISQFEDILLTKRNQAWIDRMTANMVESPTFFAVGAGHLAGPNGVIHLLRKEGYSLSPLSISKK